MMYPQHSLSILNPTIQNLKFFDMYMIPQLESSIHVTQFYLEHY